MIRSYLYHVSFALTTACAVVLAQRVERTLQRKRRFNRTRSERRYQSATVSWDHVDLDLRHLASGRIGEALGQRDLGDADFGDVTFEEDAEGRRCPVAMSAFFFLSPGRATEAEEVIRSVLDADERFAGYELSIQARWYDMQAFLREQDHPLVCKVIRELYDDGRRNTPACELVDLGVQWPNRPRYPT
ncbi:MAG: hypothetical protein AAF791_05480, partial [Bacteroidota bacterium]